jgi:neurotransmitter:Na+ symporter, NSS family
VEMWSSRRGFILAAIGSAVGIGNIWRFSSVVGQNGGGAYLVPYLIAVVCFALPLMVFEIAVGRRERANLIGAILRVRPRLELLGWLVATIVFTILSYYLVIAGWTLAFFAFAALGRPLVFGEFVGGWLPVGSFLAVATMVAATTALGVRAGIERMATLVMPLAFVLLIALAAYAVTLEGFAPAVDFLATPDFSVLGEPALWGAAAGQAFFSLSVGFGVLLTYGAYLRRGTDIVTSSVIITVADFAVALLAGVVIFSLVFTLGLEPTAGAELAFSTLPVAFEGIPGGGLLAPAFFLLLFAAALTSAVSMMELNVAIIAERTRLGRRAASAVLAGLVAALGLPSALSYAAPALEVGGRRVLDILDDTVGSFGLLLAALLITVAFAWGRSLDWLLDEVSAPPSRFHPRRLLAPLVRWAIPAVLVVLLASRLLLALDAPQWQLLPDISAFDARTGLVLAVVLVVALLPSTLAVVWVLRRLGRLGT